MNEKLELLLDFVLIFLLIFIVLSVFINKKRKDYSKLDKNDYVRKFIIRYNLDMKKTSYRKVLNALTIINSFIMSFCTVMILQIESIAWKLIITFAVLMFLIYSLYEITGRYFKKKENKMPKN